LVIQRIILFLSIVLSCTGCQFFVIGLGINVLSNIKPEQLTISKVDRSNSKNIIFAACCSDSNAGGYYSEGDIKFQILVVPENGKDGHSRPGAAVFKLAVNPARLGELSITPGTLELHLNHEIYHPIKATVCEHDELTFDTEKSLQPWTSIFKSGQDSSNSDTNNHVLPRSRVTWFGSWVYWSCLWITFPVNAPSATDNFQLALGSSFELNNKPTEEIVFNFTGYQN